MKADALHASAHAPPASLGRGTRECAEPGSGCLSHRDRGQCPDRLTTGEQTDRAPPARALLLLQELPRVEQTRDHDGLAQGP